MSDERSMRWRQLGDALNEGGWFRNGECNLHQGSHCDIGFGFGSRADRSRAPLLLVFVDFSPGYTIEAWPVGKPPKTRKVGSVLEAVAVLEDFAGECGVVKGGKCVALGRQSVQSS